MKLNIIILLLLVVIAQSDRPKLHNVFNQAAPAVVADTRYGSEINVLPSKLVVEKTGEAWTPVSEEIYASKDVDGYQDHCGRREGWVVLVHADDLTYSDGGDKTVALHG